jgi:UDP-GlcNAc:undecaprenyl-phosphate GlcNAc-1-phosphate transferase
MVFLGITFALSFGLGIVLTPLARALARRAGLVDRPDGRRKIHQGPVPLAGGIAVFVAASAAVAALWLFASGAHAEQLVARQSSLVGLWLAACFICLVGVADDAGKLRGRHKLFGQIVAVGIVMSSGVLVQRIHLFNWDIELGPLALPFTGLFLLGAINSLNLLDGMDGLLGSVATIICLALTALGAMGGQWATAAVACALAGALMAFLCFNFPPASVFLGDCGSMLVGLVVGVLAITSSLKGPATIALAAPMALLTIPFFDTTAAIIRRKLTGRSIYTTDRGHIHHCLLRSGLSNQSAIGVIGVLCLLTVGGTLTSIAFQSDALAVASGLLVIFLLVVTRLFGYAEFTLIQQRLREVAAHLRHNPARNGTDDASAVHHQIEVRLQGSVEWTEVWQDLTKAAEKLGLKGLCLDVNAPLLHEGYHARWQRLDGDGGALEPWRVEIPLALDGQSVGRLAIEGDRSPELALSEQIAAASALAEKVESAFLGLNSHGSKMRLGRVPAPEPLGGEIAVPQPVEG